MEALLSTPHVYRPPHKSGRTTGVIFVIALHILIVYGFATGLHRDIVKLIPKQIVMVDVPEIEPPPPPPPPKKIEPPAAKAPPQTIPDFVPPPEVPPVETPAVQIEATPVPVPVPEVIQPPPAPVVAAPAPASTDIRVACPQMVKPEMPRQAVMNGTTGVVKATATIRNGAVTSVTNLTGPKVFYAAVKAAMLQYKCEASAGEVVATQEFNFQLND